MHKEFGGTTALAVTLDPTLGETSEDGVHSVIMRDALLYDALAAQDSILWCNQGAYAVLFRRPDGVELLRNGVVIPLCREGMSFAQSLAAAQGKKMANLNSAADEEYANFLERESGGGETFSIDQISANYKAMLALTQDPEALVDFGMSEATARRLISELKDPRASLSSHVWDEILPKLPQAERGLAWQVSRAPYVSAVPLAKKIGMACPSTFSGDQFLALLSQRNRELPSIAVERADVDVGRYRLKVNEPALKWLLSRDTLKQMTASDLVAARSVSARALYLAHLSAHFASGDEASWLALVPHLEKYLRQAALEVFGRFVRDGRIGLGPIDKDSPVDVTGGKVIQITIPDEPEMLRLVGAVSTENVQIIGRPIAVPDLSVAPYS